MDFSATNLSWEGLKKGCFTQHAATFDELLCGKTALKIAYT